MTPQERAAALTVCDQASDPDDAAHLLAVLGFTPSPPAPRRDNRTSHRAQPIEHGTYAGYMKHRRRGVPMCDACRNASNDYNHQRRTGQA